PELGAGARDSAGERAAQESLLETAAAFSPRVEDGGEGVAYLDVVGIPALASSKGEGAERVLAQDSRAAVWKRARPAPPGIAPSKLAARVSAGLPETPRIVPPGSEAAFL